MAQAYPKAFSAPSGFQVPKAANDNFRRLPIIEPSFKPPVAANDNARIALVVGEAVVRGSLTRAVPWLQLAQLALEVGYAAYYARQELPASWAVPSGWILAVECPQVPGADFGNNQYVYSGYHFGDPVLSYCLGGQATQPNDYVGRVNDAWVRSYWRVQSGEIGNPNLRVAFSRTYAYKRDGSGVRPSVYPVYEAGASVSVPYPAMWPEALPSWLRSVAPGIAPVGVPEPGNHPFGDLSPTPWRLVPTSRPGHWPQSPVAGNGVEPAPVPLPVAKPVGRPPRGVKERKLTLRTAGGIALHVAEGITEGLDGLDAIWWALPKKYRKGKTPQGKAWDLYLHWDKVDVQKMMVNLLRNELTDRAIGRISAYVNKHGRLPETRGIFMGPAL